MIQLYHKHTKSDLLEDVVQFWSSATCGGTIRKCSLRDAHQQCKLASTLKAVVCLGHIEQANLLDTTEKGDYKSEGKKN